MGRTSVEARRNEILDVTCQVVIERGFGATRISDVAARLGVSTGLIHYHFDSKDQLLADAFQWAAEADLARLHAEVDRIGTAVERIERVIRLYAHVEAEPGWMLWIDGWGEALRDPALQRISQHLDHEWQQVLADLLRLGVAAGEFSCSDPDATAWRLTALLDGLGLQVTLHAGLLTHEQLLGYVHTAVAGELGMSEAAFARAAQRVA
ncbi:MAG TPA: TetR family transcriptional regulator C-terminal domain-containing protein [Acidimicrobiales bacterium]|nr:TetR family transcriptional regulator C-terminal domain-containing protein [Acidimicrobiales bacterium]